MTDHLATYLNDHLAGSVAGVEIAEHLFDRAETAEHRSTVEGVRDEIEQDVRTLESLMKSLDIGESRLRKAAAWLTEKATELKLRIDDPAGGPLVFFESLEALSLGIEGKRGLWLALSAAAEHEPKLRTVDYAQLIKRAEGQRSVIEEMRLAAAKRALAVTDADEE
jgi:hypothetical protein